MMLLLLSSNSRSSNSSLKSSPSFWISQVIGAILLCPPDLIERRFPMIAPFPGTMKEIRNRIEVNQLLQECWNNPDAGYEIQPTDEWIVNNQLDILEKQDTFDEGTAITRRRPSTYGEITSLGARQLFGAMGLMDCPGNQMYPQQKGNNPIHFFDLGSGTGKLVGQVVLELLPKGSVNKATGIELSPSRHESAVRAKKALLGLLANANTSRSIDRDNYFNNRIDGIGVSSLSQDILCRFDDEENNSKLELLEGDLFDADLSTATHIYVASLCFPHNLMVRLEERLQMILQQQQQQRETSGNWVKDGCPENGVLQYVATLQPFPNNLGGIRPVVRFMEMSWTKPLGCAVYLYKCNN